MSVITLRPGRAAPGTAPSDTDSSTSSLSRNRSARVAVKSSPASLTTRSSSNAIRTESRLLGPAGTSAASCTMRVTS